MEDNFQLVAAKHSLAKEFGINIDPGFEIDGYAPGHPAAPIVNTAYVFMRSKLRDIMAFWESGLYALKIMGDPGTGKSSLVEQFHARLNWPLYKFSCAPSTEAFQLIGQMYPTREGTMQWVDGPLLCAARRGHSVLLDEYNVLDPGQATGLNLLLEGYSITIPETGEIVNPASGFRVFATENSVTSRLTVAGRNVQDVANDERWMVTEADFLPPDLEVEAVKRAVITSGTQPDEAEMLARVVVGVANRVRAAYRNEELAIDRPMSTRTAIRWATLVRRFQKVSPEEGGPLVYALRRSFAMNREMATVVEEFSRVALG
jgi:cobaltochelatase CobS